MRRLTGRRDIGPAERYLVQARRRRGDPQGLDETRRAALSEAPDDLHNLFLLAMLLREEEQFPEAEAVFQHILDREPAYGAARYEISITHLLSGRPVEALLAAEAQLAREPHDRRAALLAARLLQSIGAHEQANVLLCSAAAALPEDAALFMQFGEYLKVYPRGVADHLCASLEASEHFLDTRRVIAAASEAIEQRRGFALVRLGDGEGAFMRMSPDEESRFARLYNHARIDRAHVWFAGELDLAASGFMDQAFKLAGAVGAADVIGLPYRTWLEHEYGILSATGVCSLVNALRAVRLVVREDQAFCRQDVHVNSFDTGDLQRLLERQDRIGLISCHSELPARLQAVFGLTDVEFHKLPGEKAMRPALGEEAVSGRHFPEVFEAVMAALDRPLDGKLFLVAGGILGKFYCLRIKASGGVALDVGSLADRWMDARTRPGIDGTERL